MTPRFGQPFCHVTFRFEPVAARALRGRMAGNFRLSSVIFFSRDLTRFPVSG